MEAKTTTIRLKVTPRVAELIAPGISAERQLQVIGGLLPLNDGEQLTALFLLAQRGDEEIRRQAIGGLRKLPASRLLSQLSDEGLHPQILHFIACYRINDAEVMEPLLGHPLADRRLLALVARHAGASVLQLLTARFAGTPEAPMLRQALAANPAADDRLLAGFDGREEEPSSPAAATGDANPDEDVDAGESASDEENPEEENPEEEDPDEEDSEESLSKYQMTMYMGVAEKVKAALSGDKEWRKILVMDTNKLVSAAVLKNPRISDGEVLAVAKNRSSNEELIRLITHNREWMKNYAIRQALVVHPRVPVGQALRYMSTMVERDLKLLVRSREVAQVIVNNARRLLNARQQRR